MTNREEDDALDLLEREDRELRRIFGLLGQSRGGSVEDRAQYGDLAKTLVRLVTTREAALVEVGASIEDVDGLDDITAHLRASVEERRDRIDRVEKMSRGVQGINLNTGQDFDAELIALSQILEGEIKWDLEVVIPKVRASMARTSEIQDLKSARHVARHAPTNLSPKGPQWFERAPVISRLITMYDRLRDFPKAVKHS